MIKNLRRYMWPCFVILLISLLVASCAPNKPLTVGVNEGYEPFGFSENGKQKGFEIDLMKAIAEEAGFEYKIKSSAGGQILKDVRERKIDAGVAGITIKDSRKKYLDFSTAYMHTGQMMAVKQSNNTIKKPKDLKNKIVAAKIGTSGYEYVTNLPDIKQVRAYPDIEQAFKALASGEVDVLIYDEPGIQHYAKNKGKGKIKAVGDRLTHEHYAIALPKGSMYTGRINNALKTLADNGKFKQLYNKWFDDSPESLPRQLKK